MKKIIVAFGLLLMAYSAIACDVCGCSVGGNSMGILPRFNKHFIGVRSTYSSFTSTHPSLFEGSTALQSKEYFSTTTLWGRYIPHKRVQLFAQIPYNYFVREEEGKKTITQGVGDISLLANYMVFNTTDSNKSKVKHSLQFGGGIKLPTGAYNKNEDGSLLNINMQPGSGSYDIPLNLIHTLRIKAFGVNTEMSYTFTTTNPNDYKQGNKFLGAVNFFYWKNYRNTSFLPQVGIRQEHFGVDIFDGGKVDYTGGSTTQLSIGTDVYFYKWGLGAQLRTPLRSSVGEGFIKPNPTLNFNLLYLL